MLIILHQWPHTELWVFKWNARHQVLCSLQSVTHMPRLRFVWTTPDTAILHSHSRNTPANGVMLTWALHPVIQPSYPLFSQRSQMSDLMGVATYMEHDLHNETQSSCKPLLLIILNLKLRDFFHICIQLIHCWTDIYWHNPPMPVFATFLVTGIRFDHISVFGKFISIASYSIPSLLMWPLPDIFQCTSK